METKENLKERLKHQVMERMDISRTMEDEEILELVQKTLEEDSHRMPMSISMRQNLIREIFHSLRRLDILQELIEDADITEIMVNGTKGIFYEKAGRLYQWDKHFTSEEKLQDVIQQIAGGSNRMVNELHPMDCNVPLEQLLEDFAERSRIEDVEQFAGIFSYAKRSGGDFTAIMGNTVRQMADRMELQETIETALTARKMEQKVMNVIPLFILAFVNVTSGSFLEALYGNVAGVLIMTGCLILYGLAYLWSEKIVRRIGESIC